MPLSGDEEEEVEEEEVAAPVEDMVACCGVRRVEAAGASRVEAMRDGLLARDAMRCDAKCEISKQ